MTPRTGRKPIHNPTHTPIHIVGGGLAGSEAAWQIASAGTPVVIHEMRPEKETPVHKTGHLAELVCSNSLRSDAWDANAVGLLHEEMRRANSLIMSAADTNRVPGGTALVVDRDGFAQTVEATLTGHPLITIEHSELTELPPEDGGTAIIATGPLTSDALSAEIVKITGQEHLAFFDAIAPIIYTDSIDFDVCWRQSRYDKGEGSDYINCPMDRDQYDAFILALLGAEKIEFREWEAITPYFEGCLPIEVMAERGPETLRHGPMKPVGLTNAHKPDEKSYAIVQLRQDNALGTLQNIVGFQTKLKYADQQRIFRTIPGLEQARFARLGGIHRNTFINSPALLDPTLRLKEHPHLRFAGQITGVEGYVESAAVGLMAGRFTAAEAQGTALRTPPPTTTLGALLEHITRGANTKTFQPMNINFGLMPPIAVPTHADGKRLKGKEKRRARNKALAVRALDDLGAWLGTHAAAE